MKTTINLGVSFEISILVFKDGEVSHALELEKEISILTKLVTKKILEEGYPRTENALQDSKMWDPILPWFTFVWSSKTTITSNL